MKTDAELKKDVTDELNWDPAVVSSAIGVAVKDGIVTVSGHLDTYAQRFAVERALRRVHGCPCGGWLRVRRRNKLLIPR